MTNVVAPPFGDATPRSRRVHIGAIAIDALTFEGALDSIEALVARGRGGSVFTPNVDHVVNAEQNRAFREAYSRASLSLVDGTPLLWASLLLGDRLPEKISGSDLFEPLVERAARRELRIYLLGGAPGSAEEAARRLVERHRVEVVGVDAPLIRLDGADDTIAALHRIQAAGPDLLFVGLGSPKQELWIDRHAETLRPAVAVAVGAAIDFAAGRVRRAPRWMSSVGLEWAFRLAQEPRRLYRRYLLNDPTFAAILVRSLLASRSSGRRSQ